MFVPVCGSSSKMVREEGGKQKNKKKKKDEDGINVTYKHAVRKTVTAMSTS